MLKGIVSYVVVVTNPRIICLGEILFDLLAEQIGQDLEAVSDWTAYPGGAPANVACAAQKLGTHAAFIGCVGADEPGDHLVELLESVRVDTTGVQRHSTATTRQVYVLRSETGDRSFAGFGAATDTFADTYLNSANLPSQLFTTAEFLVLGTLELAYKATREATFRALELAEQNNVKVALDVNWRPMFWPNPEEAKPLIQELYKGVDLLKLSEEESTWLFQTEDAGEIAHRDDTPDAVIVTAGGEAPVSYCFGKHEGKVPPFSVAVVDTTGAGDAFLAGVIHQLCRRGMGCLDNEEMVREIVTYGCAVGALTTTKPGAIAAQPTATEVDLFLNHYLINL